MTKIVYNDCFGGFSLSDVAITKYKKLKGGVLPDNFYDRDIERDDPALVQVVEELGALANGAFAALAIKELPTGTEYIIEEYDGNESVCTKDSYNWKIA